MRTRIPTLALLGALCVAASGCRDREVTSYRVPKEKDAPHAAAAPAAPANAASATPAGPAPTTPTMPPAAGGATMANTAVATASGDLSWTAPASWQSKPASAMRKATYAIPAEGGAGELAITAFPGDVGGETANINRWRGQISLPPASAADLAGVTRFDANGLKFAVVDYDNGQQRLLGAIVPVKGSTWFFKLTGPAAPMAKEKDAFLAFLKTVKAP